MKTDTSRVPVFMLTQAVTMGVADGRQTPRPPETPTDDVHEPVARYPRFQMTADPWSSAP